MRSEERPQKRSTSATDKCRTCKVAALCFSMGESRFARELWRCHACSRVYRKGRLIEPACRTLPTAESHAVACPPCREMQRLRLELQQREAQKRVAEMYTTTISNTDYREYVINQDTTRGSTDD